MGIKETEHEFVITDPDGQIHKFKIMLGLVDEDGYQFYDENDRENITTCSCGKLHPFNSITTMINFGKIERSEYPFQLNIGFIATLLHGRHFDIRKNKVAVNPVKVLTKYFNDFEIIHELEGSSDDLEYYYGTVNCGCKAKSEKWVDKFGCLEHQHWIDPSRLVYIYINEGEILACVGHPFFTGEYSKKLVEQYS